MFAKKFDAIGMISLSSQALLCSIQIDHNAFKSCPESWDIAVTMKGTTLHIAISDDAHKYSADKLPRIYPAL